MTDRSDRLLARLGLRHPIVQAPMATALTPPPLVAAVCEAGALGSLAGAYDAPEAISAAADEVRRRTARPFAINLFIPVAPAPEVDPAPSRAVLDAFRRELGVDPPASVASAPVDFDAQFEAVLRARPAVFSFTMGALDRDRTRALHELGAFVIGTATSADEAAALEDAGVDAVCAQGAEAGGHRGSFLRATDDSPLALFALVPQVVARVRVPVLAAGGITDGAGVAAALALGASAAQLGTAFLACPEAGTHAAHRAALADARATRTVLTRAFSGRHGRAIANRYTAAFERVEVPPFPGFGAHTRDVRAAAAKQGRADLMQLWAGEGAPRVRAMPAAELVATLARETEEAIRAFAG